MNEILIVLGAVLGVALLPLLRFRGHHVMLALKEFTARVRHHLRRNKNLQEANDILVRDIDYLQRRLRQSANTVLDLQKTLSDTKQDMDAWRVGADVWKTKAVSANDLVEVQQRLIIDLQEKLERTQTTLGKVSKVEYDQRVESYGLCKQIGDFKQQISEKDAARARAEGECAALKNENGVLKRMMIRMAAEATKKKSTRKFSSLHGR